MNTKDTSLALSPFLSQLWLTFYQQAIQCPTLNEETIYDVLSYCFNIPSCRTGVIKSLYQAFFTSNLIIFQHTENRFYLSRTSHIQGVLAHLAPCYAPGCHPSLPCYSPTCPNRLNTRWLQLHSLLETEDHAEWHHHAPTYILNTFPAYEIKRQCVLAELLQSELDYCHDLSILNNVYAEPFLALDHPDRQLYHLLFRPALDLQQYHQQFCQFLVRHRQHPLFLFNEIIGPALLDHTNALFEPYVLAATSTTKALYLLKLEIQKSPTLRQFILQQNSHPLTRKLDLEHFVKRPTLRLTKFKVQLEAIHKYSQHESDQVHILAAMDLLHQLLYQVNDAVRKADAHVQLLRISSSLVTHHQPSSSSPPLRAVSLYDPQRPPTPPRTSIDTVVTLESRAAHPVSPATFFFSWMTNKASFDVSLLLKDASLLHQGQFRLSRSSSHSLLAQPCHIFLFSHALLLTKPKKSGYPTTTADASTADETPQTLEAIRRPIPLPMLSVSIHRANLMRRLSHRLARQQQPLGPSQPSPPTSPLRSLSSSSSPKPVTKTVDLRHRFSITSTTSSWSASSSSTDSHEDPALPMVPPTLATFADPASHPPSPHTSPSSSRWLQRQPTLSGMHIRAHLRRQLHHWRSRPSSKSRPHSPMSTHSHLPLTSSPEPIRASSPKPATPVFFRKRVLSPRLARPHYTNNQYVPHLHSSPCTLVIRHLADPAFMLEIKARNTKQRDQWYDWFRTALEQSAQTTTHPAHRQRSFRRRCSTPFYMEILCEISLINKQSLQIDDVRLSGGCGRVYCCLPFVTDENVSMIALGTQHGLWLGSTSSNETSFQLIEMLECQQLALVDNRFLIARANGSANVFAMADLISHMSHAIDDIVHLRQPSAIHSFSIKSSSVLDIAVGSFYGHTTVCYLAKCSLRQRQKYRRATRILVIGTIKQSPSRAYFKKEKTIPLLMKNGASISFLGNQIFVCSPDHGLERVDIISGTTWLQCATSAGQGARWIGCTSFPVTDAITNRTSTTWSPYSLVCSETACWVLNNESMAIDETDPYIRFEATARSVSLINDYLIVFAKFVVEIRHISTGDIVQVIPGHDIRCVYMHQNTLVLTRMKSANDPVCIIYKLCL
ncbi:hypothetical protein DM01DRAFT_1406261 [Hesseltinella vesiculosa]|uniref:DH domain-containing protein n=1 Tax=Hesseltinella vesiculosa TaxID=101127 RepID=A0A1X2GLM8_9FUNG|nr:hypothetical protein DM01DRAFT_1406261 [Hesseltinella vesiculosa]